LGSYIEFEESTQTIRVWLLHRFLSAHTEPLCNDLGLCVKFSEAHV
jgi:hypothetical protein